MSETAQTVNALSSEFNQLGLHRPMQVSRYEVGQVLKYDIHGVQGGGRGRMKLVVDKFVGGGFAGQVYRVKLEELELTEGEAPALVPGGMYAIKVLIPPSGFSVLFRNVLYRIGFQGAFQLQVNPAAARSGALWQQFIQRGAQIKFGHSDSVASLYATFVDSELGSCGEISEWIEGRTWQLEVDDRLDLLKQWKKGKPVAEEKLGSPEFRSKKVFMDEFVDLLHEIGAHEFARQYEWSTCKSQPNCLKRLNTEGDPKKGLVAVDFRAGLVLLPFLPMSPGDIPLIFKGLARGSLVQFDRGSIKELEDYIAGYPEEFSGMEPLLEELKEAEHIYRNSLPDIAHNPFGLFNPKRLAIMKQSTVTSWRIRNLISEATEVKLQKSFLPYLVFLLLGCVPFLGRALRKCWGREDWRRHYASMLGNFSYLGKAVSGKIIERLIGWYRAGRITEERVGRLTANKAGFLLHLPFSFLPVGLHRLCTDSAYAKDRVYQLMVRPVRLYFDKELREQWLRDMVADGREKNLLHEEDEKTILSQLNEPFIQKYLKSLAVHVCTVPVTQVVSVIVALTYVLMHPEMPRAHAWGIGVGIIALFQVVPISPGSLARGLYVLFLVLRERNFKDYNIAVFLGFFKYIGYLAFPIQMSYRYPALARFMSGYWATEAVHVVPVFGEKGALLEHAVYSLFYNWPLTIRRRMNERAEIRKTLNTRLWHVPVIALLGVAVMGGAHYVWLQTTGQQPSVKDFWWLNVLVPGLGAVVITLAAGGAVMWKRIAGGAVSGLVIAVLYTFVMVYGMGAGSETGDLIVSGLWRFFIFTLVSVAAVVGTEMSLQGKTD
ncbi:MAG: hypothetical protein HQK83_19910 [Fibrobacteria bacterium]|nr:hypothetical protein [Fibrobacteria bacterium]